jgi:hypothetical protein
VIAQKTVEPVRRMLEAGIGVTTGEPTSRPDI